MNLLADDAAYQPQRRNLVLVRAGAQALHLQWQLPAVRNWDLVTLAYNDALLDAASSGNVVVPGEWLVDGRAQATKYIGIQAFFRHHPEALKHEAVLMLDDDLLFDPARLDDMFGLFATSGAALGQPALTWDSYASLYITFRNRAFLWRETNFAEVMAPMMTSAILRDLLPTFDANRSSWGFDFLWADRCRKAGGRVVILDQTPIKHTRPIGGGGLYAALKVDPGAELADLLRQHGIERPPLRVLGGRLDPSFKRPVTGLLVESYLSGLGREMRQRKGFSSLFKASLPYLLRRAR